MESQLENELSRQSFLDLNNREKEKKKIRMLVEHRQDLTGDCLGNDTKYCQDSIVKMKINRLGNQSAEQSEE